MKIKNSKGFTLIELLIVVAIIAILAAIAIPQFASYRVRGYNSAATADLRNGRTAEEAFFSDWQAYCSTQTNGGAGMGIGYNNQTGALNVTAGSIVAADPATGQPAVPSANATFNTGVSQNVTLIVNTLDPGANTNAMFTKNTAGDRCYAMSSGITSIYWIGGTLGQPLDGASTLAATTAGDSLAPGGAAAAGASMCPGTTGATNWATL